jgi:mono/diheme cytochrome c family protein
MKGASLITAIAVPFGVFVVFASGVDAQDKPVSRTGGSSLFRTYCGACHGSEAKGDGPIASSLRVAPPDLTLIAKRNKGVFPEEDVHRMVDGRKPVKGHGGADMPVWGDAFKASTEGYSEEKVKEKIDALVDFLKSIQVNAS